MEPVVLSGILGFVVPPVVAFLQRSSWPKWVKIGLSLVVSGGVAVVSLIQDGKLTEASKEQILANVGAAFVIAQAFYHFYFKNTEVNAKLEAKEVL